MIAQLKADGNYANYEGSTKNADGTTSGDPSYETTATTNGRGHSPRWETAFIPTRFSGTLRMPQKHWAALSMIPPRPIRWRSMVSRTITDAFGRTFQQVKNVYFNLPARRAAGHADPGNRRHVQLQ